MNELVTPRAHTADEPRAARKALRVLAVEALGPLTVLGGIVWAFAQPYRVTFFYPDGKGFWEWAVQPPLLVVLVGLLFALLVAPGLVEDLDEGVRDLERENGIGPKHRGPGRGNPLPIISVVGEGESVVQTIQDGSGAVDDERDYDAFEHENEGLR